MSLLDAVHQYHDEGWSCIPLVPGGKRARVEWATLTRHECHTRAERWWDKWPSSPIGVLTGHRSNGLVVIDVDAEDDALESKDRIFLNHVPDGTWTVSTPSGGRHFYLYADARIRNRNRITPNVDVRGDGGLVVAPPSPGREILLGGPVADMSRRLTDFLTRTQRAGKQANYDYMPGYVRGFGERALDDAADAVEAAPHGQRNESLNREVYYLTAYVARGELGPDEVADRLAEAAHANPHGPPMGDREIQRTISSALSTIQKDSS